MRKIRNISLNELWFMIIIFIVAALLYEQAISLNTAASWLRLFFFFLVLALSSLVARNYIRERRKLRRNLEKTYAVQLRRKDDMIRQLKKEKDMFLKSALKRSEKSREIEHKLKEAIKER